MHGMGTILNVVLIICGSLLGLFIRHRMKDNLKETLMMVCGIIILLLGMSGTMQYMLVIVSDSLHTTPHDDDYLYGTRGYHRRAYRL